MNYARQKDRIIENFVAERQWRQRNVTVAPNLIDQPKSGLWHKLPQYPESFQLKPQHADVVSSTLYKDIPHHLVSPLELEVIQHHWDTTSGQAHKRKFLPWRFQQELITMPPTLTKITHMFPHVQNRMKFTSEKLYYDPNPVSNTIMKSHYKPVRPIADFDYTNGTPVQVDHPRRVRFVRRTELKPGFKADDRFSFLRKFNPYVSITSMDFIPPPKNID